MKTLYIETKMGVAGDMLSAALLELCDDKVEILNKISGIGIPGVSFNLEKSEKCGIVGSHMNVIVNGEEEASADVAYDCVSSFEHDHDSYDHDHEHSHDHNHEHSHDHDSNDHNHEHSRDHDSNDHDHEHSHDHDSNDHDHEHSHDHDSNDLNHEHSHDHDSNDHDHEHSHDHDSNDHDHEHSHNHDSHDHDHEHYHDNEHDHNHNHDHDHEHHNHDHHHHHHHRGMKEIEHIVEALNLDEAVKADILNVYRLIADAESKVHGRDVAEIHFHEVGTLDAIADIAAACLLMHELAPEKVVVSPIHVGSGQVRCAHGILPVPAPATALLLRGIPFYSGDVRGELCTPTGAALIRYFATEYGAQPVMSVSKIGYGMGKKDFPQANCVRVFVGETVDGATTPEIPADALAKTSAAAASDTPTDALAKTSAAAASDTPADALAKTSAAAASDTPADAPTKASAAAASDTPEDAATKTSAATSPDTLADAPTKTSAATASEIPADAPTNMSTTQTATPTDTITELVCNLDDMTPEAIGFAMERLMEDGALDVFTTAIGMKKNRPGTMLTVLCKENKKEELVRKIFRYTTTIGIRENICKRYILNREEKTISTSDGEIRVKEVSGYGVKREKKEYEDIAAIARKKGTALN
ncbi:LarC family nickel insertion protein [Butyrivibrio sp. JL13D10]|uniref:LarC family nickel insertion protein n=1 Tax=Butyrivibrio sp. JL13D10 TaxID=3236815 RepID=UPI0038B54088